ncbi:glycoside hydrolase family 6 protein [Pseudonocardia abyssalis]|uniref:glycoside hydrolase family 6 protein n=1 Tax=Pseudonocardia abyssalis TaxID=2792008 RepID=UPI001C4A135F|nr:glycoside hydrolase family 6 protein [Pseudonocardia abyssalis]
MPRRRRAAPALLLASAALFFGACAGSVPAPVALPSPTGFYVDPESPAAVQAREWSAQGRTADAALIDRIAAQPVPQWLTAPTGQVGAQVSGYVDRARSVGQIPLLVPYHVPDRDCGSFSGGGAVDAEDYRAWIREVAAELRDGPATVVLEPDAVPHELAGCADSGAGRAELLSDAVTVLKAAGQVTVYVDAGNPGFITDVDALAGALRASGVGAADGFALNVANFWPDADVVAFGREISARLGGAHFVVDSGRNGNGRVTDENVDGGPSFCNPPGRAVGRVPTLETGDPLVDGYLWIKRVGESDGACRPGEPVAGRWWPEYALGLVERAGG